MLSPTIFLFLLDLTRRSTCGRYVHMQRYQNSIALSLHIFRSKHREHSHASSSAASRPRLPAPCGPTACTCGARTMYRTSQRIAPPCHRDPCADFERPVAAPSPRLGGWLQPPQLIANALLIKRVCLQGNRSEPFLKARLQRKSNKSPACQLCTSRCTTRVNWLHQEQAPDNVPRWRASAAPCRWRTQRERAEQGVVPWAVEELR